MSRDEIDNSGVDNHEVGQHGLDMASIEDALLSKIRLGVMAYLSSVNPATFPELAHTLEASNGNLSTHLSKLEKAGLVCLEKGYNGKRPQTLVRLTDHGRTAWSDYLSQMQKVLLTATEL